MFLGLLDPDPDPDPLVRGMDLDPDPVPDLDPSNKNCKKNLDFSCFVTSFHRTYVYCDIVITKLRLLRHRNYKITPIATS